MTSELASYKGDDDSEYTRQIITIKKSTYEFLRDEAQKVPGHRIKIGDVIEHFIRMAQSSFSETQINDSLDSLRQQMSPKKLGRKPFLEKLKNLSNAEREAVFALMDKKKDK